MRPIHRFTLLDQPRKRQSTSSSLNPASLTQVKLYLPWSNASIINLLENPAEDGQDIGTWYDSSTSARHAAPGGTTQYAIVNGVHNVAGSAHLDFTPFDLEADFTIYVRAVILGNLYSLGKNANNSAVLIASDLIKISGDDVDNNSQGASIDPGVGLKTFRFRRYLGANYIAWTGLSEEAFVSDNLSGVLSFGCILAATSEGASVLDSFSNPNSYLQSVVVADESVTPLTAGQRSGIEIYLGGAAL